MQNIDSDWLDYCLPILRSEKEIRTQNRINMIKEFFDWSWRIGLISSAIYFLIPFMQ